MCRGPGADPCRCRVCYLMSSEFMVVFIIAIETLKIHLLMKVRVTFRDMPTPCNKRISLLKHLPFLCGEILELLSLHFGHTIHYSSQSPVAVQEHRETSLSLPVTWCPLTNLSQHSKGGFGFLTFFPFVGLIAGGNCPVTIALISFIMRRR